MRSRLSPGSYLGSDGHMLSAANPCALQGPASPHPSPLTIGRVSGTQRPAVSWTSRSPQGLDSSAGAIPASPGPGQGHILHSRDRESLRA